MDTLTSELAHLDLQERERLRRAAERLSSYPFEFWHYGDSIGLEGLVAASDALGDDAFVGWVYGALKSWSARRRPFVELDNTAAGHAMCTIVERTSDEAILEAASELADYLRSRPRLEGAFVSFSEAPLRTPHGGEELDADSLALLRDPGPGVFIDCLHFDPPFFAHLGSLRNERGLVDEAAAQALTYVRLLQDESGLFWHFWLERTRQRYGLAWSRGQGWALLGLVDLLRYLPDDHSTREELTGALVALASALFNRQEETGGWTAVAGDPSSGVEASTSAFVAAGFAAGVQQGLLGQEFEVSARRAWDDAWSQVDDDGMLANVSAAVWASTAQSHYVHVPRGFLVPWGQGPLLVAALRIGRL
jgi:unsaturated rhamnogalacturonyl hydrolase